MAGFLAGLAVELTSASSGGDAMGLVARGAAAAAAVGRLAVWRLDRPLPPPEA